MPLPLRIILFFGAVTILFFTSVLCASVITRGYSKPDRTAQLATAALVVCCILSGGIIAALL